MKSIFTLIVLGSSLNAFALNMSVFCGDTVTEDYRILNSTLALQVEANGSYDNIEAVSVLLNDRLDRTFSKFRELADGRGFVVSQPKIHGRLNVAPLQKIEFIFDEEDENLMTAQRYLGSKKLGGALRCVFGES